MPFHNRLRLLQWLTIAGLFDIGLGLVLLVVASRFMPAPVILWLLATGFALALACSITLSRLRCPRCGNTFCGPRHDENQRSSIFTSRCLSCGMRPSPSGLDEGRGLPTSPRAVPPAVAARPPSASVPLPKEVLAVLEGGHTIEAIRLLRQSQGIGLKEAKDAIDHHLAGRPVRVPPTGAPAAPLPAAAAAALARGDKIEAIRLAREQAGLGLKQAKELVDSLERPAAWRGDGLAPGEVRDSGSGFWLGIVLAGVAALVYYLVFGLPV